MDSNRVAGFLPSSSGFAFTNDFPDVAVVRLRVPFAGRIGVGRAGNGMCGGMAFAARDYFESGETVPELDTVPAPDSPLFGYLVRRLIAAFNTPTGLLRYWWWMTLADANRPLRRGVRRRTLAVQARAIQDSIDAGHPCPLGLVTVHGWRPSLMRHNHVVLAWGYERGADALTLRAYDPNSGRADDVSITVPHDPAEPVTSNVGIDRPVRGCFALRYRVRDPRCHVRPGG